jgi:histone-lysine N-methyltransferase SETD2
MCVNGRNCSNRALQQRSYAKLRLFKSALCGYGMKALEDINPGQLVQEYIGEVVTVGEMHNRLATYRPGQPVCVLISAAADF